MKTNLIGATNYSVAVLVGLFCWAAAAGAAQSKPAGSGTTNVLAAVAQQEIPRSLFVQGRNPFFPQSSQPAPVVRTKDSPVDTSGLVLNGITPNGIRRTAMINSRTFETGESGEVKMPNGGKLLIKCEEIRNDSAVIIIDGQRHELRLRFGL